MIQGIVSAKRYWTRYGTNWTSEAVAVSPGTAPLGKKAGFEESSRTTNTPWVFMHVLLFLMGKSNLGGAATGVASPGTPPPFQVMPTSFYLSTTNYWTVII